MTDVEGLALLDLSLAYSIEQFVEFYTYIGLHGAFIQA